MKTVLVTGGAGFVGSHLAHRLIHQHSYRVVVLDSLTVAANVRNLSDLEDNERFTFVRGDIGDRRLVTALFDEYGFDCVVNLAAESYMDRSITDPEIFVSTNVLGTQVLLNEARDSWRIRPGDARCTEYRDGVRFVQASIAEVYGDLPSDRSGFRETDPLAPRTPYAASKAGADLMVAAYHDTFGLPTNIVRSSINFGPFQFPNKLIAKTIESHLSQRRMPLYGDAGQSRDWLFVEDNCAALDIVLHHGRIGEVYNVGGSRELTNLEVVRSVLGLLSAAPESTEHVHDWPGDSRRLVLDARKIREELGWEISHSFETDLESTVNWYLAHPEWLRQVTTGAYREFNRSTR